MSNTSQTSATTNLQSTFSTPIVATTRAKFSVLISVYKSDDPRFFDEAMRSVTSEQTRVPDEVVLVVDGPVDGPLSAVIQQWESQRKFRIHVIRSPNNIGLSRALNLGLKHCSHPYVARMDSDDVSVPTRFEQQMDFLSNHPNVDLLGGWYQQYDRTLETYLSDRRVPRDMSQLVAFSKTRTPFNHVTGVFKRTSLLSVGGYPDIDGYSEDWWVALRLIKNGNVLENLPEYLVKVRGDGDFIGRRGGLAYIRHEINNLTAMRRQGLMTTWDLAKNIVLRTPVRLLPLRFRTMIYQAIRQA